MRLLRVYLLVLLVLTAAGFSLNAGLPVVAMASRLGLIFCLLFKKAVQQRVKSAAGLAV